MNRAASYKPTDRSFISPHYRLDVKMRGFECMKGTKPVFYRTHINNLSTVTNKPSVHIDTLQNYGLEERSVYIFLYDMSYRYDLNSSWFWKFLAIVQGYRHVAGDQESDNENNRDYSNEVKDESAGMMTKVMLPSILVSP